MKNSNGQISKKRMAESSTRKARKTGRIKKDRISVLPRNILETILCCLPIRDAVRTSVLSRVWRHCWTTVPDLVFDECVRNMWMDHNRVLTALKLVSVINMVLLRHNGPILKFSLTIPLYCCDFEVVHDYIDQWIPVFSRMGIRQFTLDQYYQVHRVHNFSTLNLSHLRLRNVWFPYKSAVGGLTYLRIIELIKVSASEESIFSCPVLEKLSLIYCKGLLPSNFRAPNLKCLHQMYWEMTSEFSLSGLENLTEFSCRLSSWPEMHNEKSNMVKVFSSLHKIEKICIAKCSITYLAAGGSPKRFTKPLPYLKTLCICDIDLNCLSEVSCLRCLIRSAPNLCKLHISGSDEAEEENLNSRWEDASEECTVDHLEIVTFSNFRGLEGELELVKFLLASSPLLKTMFIHYDWEMGKDDAFEILEEMLEFSRASPRAQIKHLKYPFHAVDYGPWVGPWLDALEE
ncbi:F-box/FBD/LRR-repeat protein At1g13570 [Daucus carota subsp. sativus]|uniref:F-box/FBD/LRR-repeat protein At1g13570 n=1 Tax=Daucus carota subsp. sativus TaxID=79200 RepID=UPI0007EFDEC3|nr:PREDICTED: F-box/FBD/LRR-repeat protein At1g13570-like [Daucus carota subsp. sativus]